MRISTFFSLLGLLLMIACSGPRKARKTEREILDSEVFKHSFTGFVLMDAQTGKILNAVHPDQYFIPASNTKILTTAACMAILGDTLKTLEYVRNGESTVIIRGTGDPTFLNPSFDNWQNGFQFLQQWQVIRYTPRPMLSERYGPGWAWEDYAERFQQERSVFPIYENSFILQKDINGQKMVVKPAYFDIFQSTGKQLRKEFSNHWNGESIKPGESRLIPFTYSDGLLKELLKDTLHHKDVETMPYLAAFDDRSTKWTAIKSCPADTVYRRMMQESDNHLAEQLLLMAAMQNTGTTDMDSLIRHTIMHIFPPSAQPPRWVDGSGLSRYNLVTPRYISEVLRDMLHKYGTKRVLSVFPAGGSNGTIAHWYTGPEGKPYVFAKTGTLGGVHNLSGYLIAKSGKMLIFSFMHNNFRGSSSIWKAEMQRILSKIYQDY